MTDDHPDTQRMLKYRDEAHVLTKERDDLHDEVERLRGERDGCRSEIEIVGIERDEARASCSRLIDDVDKLDSELERVKRDNNDWLLGLALIASALGESDPPNLAAARIADVALNLRAEIERVTRERDAALPVAKYASDAGLRDRIVRRKAEAELDAMREVVDAAMWAMTRGRLDHHADDDPLTELRTLLESKETT